MDADFVVSFTAETKRRISALRERTARSARLMPWTVAASLSIAVLMILVGVSTREPGAWVMAALLIGVAVLLVVLVRKDAHNAPLPLPDLAFWVRGDELWLSGDATASGTVKRAAETWSLSATTVTLGTKYGQFPAVVFSTPGRKPRSYFLANLDQSGGEILAQIEFRKSKILR
ncbi:MAG: hypothetical protein K4304_06550 [Propionicimonas sp.]